MPATVNTVQTSTYVLSNPATQIPLTIGPNGGIDVDSSTAFANGISGGGGVAWSITNLGTVASIGVQGVGINLPDAGFVSNGTAGSTAGYMNATSVDIQISGPAGATGTVANYGRIVVVSPNTYANGIIVNTVSGLIVNTGSIVAVTSNSDANGIALNGPGIVINNGFIAALNGINDNGIDAATTSTNIVNNGTITGSGSNFGVGISLYGGIVNNPGLIDGTSGGIDAAGSSTVTTITNGGTIASVGGTTTFGAQVQGTAAISNAGLITAAGEAVSAAGGLIKNSGTIVETTGAGQQALSIGSGASTVVNTGTISAASTSGDAVQVGTGGGTIVNGQAGTGLGMISGYHTGIGFFPPIGVASGLLAIVNYGIIQTTQAGPGAGNAFTINTGQGTSTSVDNFGTISSAQANGGGGVLLSGGEVANQAGALISAAGGIAVEGNIAPLLVTNAGTIVGAGANGIGVDLNNGGTLTNSGTIIGKAGQAVNFGGTGANRMIVDPGAVFVGSVAGGAGTLELAAGNGLGGAFYGLGTSITNFATVQFDSGADWTLASNPGGFPANITGFAAGDTISIAGFVATSESFSNNTLTLTNAGGGQTTLGIQGGFSTGSFTIVTGNAFGGTQVTLDTAQPFTTDDPLMTNTNGSLVFDEVVNGQIAFAAIGGLGPEWEFDGNGDFLGAGSPGFLIRDNGASEPGALFVGSDVNGAASFTEIGGLGAEWQFEGSGNFLGTGQSEFLIRNTGSVIPGAIELGQVVTGAGGPSVSYTSLGGLGLEWQFEGTGDFLNDGHQGFLIRNTGADLPGVLDVGEIANGTVNYTQIGGVGTEWNFEGTGDFLGDGNTSFLLWNNSGPQQGAMAIGEYTNGQLNFTDIGGVGSEWQFVGTGNYIDGNKTDFLLRDTANGTLAVGSVTNGAANFTTVGGIGSEWNFHLGNPALLA